MSNCTVETRIILEDNPSNEEPIDPFTLEEIKQFLKRVHKSYQSRLKDYQLQQDELMIYVYQD